MKRISFIFAAILAAGFAFQPRSPNDRENGKSEAVTQNQHKPAGSHLEHAKKKANKIADPKLAVHQEAARFIEVFKSKSPHSDLTGIDALFATMPDPIQTHLAAGFDNNVAALQDGIEDAGYLFDSAWIPWESANAYDSLGDSIAATDIREEEHVPRP